MPKAIIEIPSPTLTRALRQRWAHFIKQVSEADPLLCPQCGGAMQIIAFIDDAAAIEKILTHLGLWLAHAHGPPEAAAYGHRGQTLILLYSDSGGRTEPLARRPGRGPERRT